MKNFSIEILCKRCSASYRFWYKLKLFIADPINSAILLALAFIGHKGNGRNLMIIFDCLLRKKRTVEKVYLLIGSIKAWTRGFIFAKFPITIFIAFHKWFPKALIFFSSAHIWIIRIEDLINIFYCCLIQLKSINFFIVF